MAENKRRQSELEAMLHEAVARARQILRPNPSGATKKKAAKSRSKRSGASAKKRKRVKTVTGGGRKRSARPRKIEPVSAMKMSEFKKLPKSDPAFTFFKWKWKRRLKTACGEFGVELFTEDNEPLDDKMLRLAEEFARYTQTHSEYIRELIYGYYRYCVTEYGADSLFCDMPANLPRERIWKYCNPDLNVWRDSPCYQVGPPYRCLIAVYPEWETEHGLSLEFSNGAIVTVNRAPFEIVDGILRERPRATVVPQEPETPQPTPKEMALAYAKEMQTMGAQLEAMISGKSEERQRWEKLFPAPPTNAAVETDPSIIYGDWKLDPGETARVMTKLGEETSVAEARKEWGNHLYRISRETLQTFKGKALYDEMPYLECRRRGNRFDFVIHSDSIWEHWFDGKILVDQCGMVYRRAAEQSSSKAVKRRKAQV